MKSLYVLIFFLCSVNILNSQVTVNDSTQSKPTHSKNQNADVTNNPLKAATADNFGFISQLEFVLSASVLCFGLIVILFEIYLIKKNQIGPDTTVKFIVVTLIIISTLFLITAGYSNNQIAPATGLLGTIAGYLLGKANSSPQPNNNG